MQPRISDYEDYLNNICKEQYQKELDEWKTVTHKDRKTGWVLLKTYVRRFVKRETGYQPVNPRFSFLYEQRRYELASGDEYLPRNI